MRGVEKMFIVGLTDKYRLCNRIERRISSEVKSKPISFTWLSAWEAITNCWPAFFCIDNHAGAIRLPISLLEIAEKLGQKEKGPPNL